MLLAIEAVETSRRHHERPFPAAEQALRDSLGAIGGQMLVEHLGATKAVGISRDARWLALTSGDNRVRLWDLSGDGRGPNPVDLHGHTGPVCCVKFSADSRRLATGSLDRTARVWDLTAEDPSADPVVLRGYNDAIGCVAPVQMENGCGRLRAERQPLLSPQQRPNPSWPACGI